MSMVKLNKDKIPAATGPKSCLAGPRITLAALESLAVPLVQEVVFLADFRCTRCHERVAEILSKMNGETQSVMISVLEKKVTLSCTYPMTNNLLSRHRRCAAATPHPSSRGKISKVVRLLRSSCI